MEQVVLNINGDDRTVAVENGWSVLYVLQEVLGMTGTKCGCNTCQCGSCKIIVDGEAVNACSVNPKKAVGKKIQTIEGLAKGNKLHPIQQAFIDCGAVQCGFCTPGMIMSAKALLDQNPDPAEADIRKAIDKNLCRCTGYVKIVQDVQEAARRMREG